MPSSIYNHYWMKGDNNPSKRPEVRIKLSKARRKLIASGWVSPTKGIPRTDEVKRKISIKNSGSGNGQWKGDKVRRAIHSWVRRRKIKPNFCEECNSVPPMDLSNIDHKYRRDIDDYRWLCRKCHVNYDIDNKIMGLGMK